MKTGKSRTLRVCAVASVAAFSAAAQAGGGPGQWQRSADWLPGVPGAVSGAPGPGGPAIWTYEFTSSGGSLLDPAPWYSTPASPLRWDENWWETGQGVWSAGDNVSPPVDQNRAAHNVAGSDIFNVPVIRFTNPTGTASLFDITGILKVVWDGVGGVGRPNTVDVVVGKQNAAHSSTTLLYSTTVNKPNNFASVGDFVDLPVLLSDVLLSQGESIIISHRGRSAVEPGGWIHLHDQMNINLIPTPGSLVAMGLGGVLATRRRRR